MEVLWVLGLLLQLCILFLQLWQLRGRASLPQAEEAKGAARSAAAAGNPSVSGQGPETPPFTQGRLCPPQEPGFEKSFQEGLGRLMAYDLAAARRAVQKHGE